MEQTFEDYLKQARQDFAKVASQYTVTEHLKLRTAIDSLLIAYDQAVSQALNLHNVSKRIFRFSGMSEGVKFIINVRAINRETAITYFEGEHPNLIWRTTTEITDIT
jgi:hypothetical protein